MKRLVIPVLCSIAVLAVVVFLYRFWYFWNHYESPFATYRHPFERTDENGLLKLSDVFPDAWDRVDVYGLGVFAPIENHEKGPFQEISAMVFYLDDEKVDHFVYRIHYAVHDEAGMLYDDSRAVTFGRDAVFRVELRERGGADLYPLSQREIDEMNQE